MTIRSIFTGLTGVNAMGRGIDVIGNNIANVNTVGYRAGRATFDDIYSQTLFAGVGPQDQTGGINPRQLGTGVSLGSVDLIFTQGNVQTTGRLLDLAIQGDGFFVMRNSNAQQVLTRAGNFTLDGDGFIVDPANGNRLLGRQSNSLGQIDTENPIDDMRIDFNISIPAEQTTQVQAGGNLSGDEAEPARVSNNLRGLFNRYGESLGLINGDEIRFETGFVDVGDPPPTLVEPLDLAQFDFGNGGPGVILKVTEDTTIEDLGKALDDALDATIEESITGAQSGFDVQFDSDQGRFVFRTTNDALKGIRIGLSPRGTDNDPPANSYLLGEIFSTRDDPNFTRTLDAAANSTVRTENLRQANTTSSIEVFDSQGNPKTLTLGYARDTRPTEAIGSTTMNELRDRDGRQIIEGGFPPKIEYLDPVLDNTNNTAVFSAYQVDNIVATQGIYTFNSGNVMMGLRLSDGAISFNGGTFYLPGQTTTDNDPPNGAPPTNNLNADTIALLQALDVTGNERLNIGGGLMGDEGFTEATTLEDIRNQIESKVNSALAGLTTAIGNLTDSTHPLANVFALAIVADEIDGLDPAAVTVPALGALTEAPSVEITLTEEGSMAWGTGVGNLGKATLSGDPAIDAARAAALAVSAGGEESLALQLDLAARTRSIRVSTARNTGGTLQPDSSVDDLVAGGVTGFGTDPFHATLATAFTVGNDDYAGSNVLTPGDYTASRPGDGFAALTNDPRWDGNPLLPNPTGIFDSGVRLIALTDGVYSDDPSRPLPTYPAANDPEAQTSGRFGGTQAFQPVANAFNTIFNRRGFGQAVDSDGDTTLDRLSTNSNSGDVPNGIVVGANDVALFETNTLHDTGVRNNSWSYQLVLNNDESNVPLGHTGFVDFTSEGLFNSYAGTQDTPTINFDPDGEDPVNGGVTPLSFTLDLTGVTQFGQARTTATLLNQDGRAVGSLDSVSIAPDGQILGIFTNGATRALGQVALAQVTNPGGLMQLGDTLFIAGPNSGTPQVFDPGDGGTGIITSGQLELSNVDLATEFTNLIVTQRAFQANSRMITTGNEVLQEVVNLVR